MPKIQFQPATTPWPLAASYANTRLIFSGSFDLLRIQKEFKKNALDKTITGLLICFSLVGIACIGYELYQANLANNFAFIIRKNLFNFIFLLSLYADLYLWAKNSTGALQEKKLSLLHLENNADGQGMLDLYSLLSPNALKFWNGAAILAKKKNIPVVDSVIILESLCRDHGVALALGRLRINANDFLVQLAALAGHEHIEQSYIWQLPFLAFEEALAHHAKKMDATCIFYALIKNLPQNSVLTPLLREYDLDIAALEVLYNWQINVGFIEEEIWNVRKFGAMKTFKTNKSFTAVPTPYLDQFSEDLTYSAKAGHLPLTIGRGPDLDEIFKLFSQQNRFICIKGAEGTGRSTVIDELAYKMVSEDVPQILEDKRLVQLELASILGSGSAPEEVLQNALAEAAKSDNIILALEDIHLLAQAKGAHGLNLLQILVSRLQEGSLMALATTTPNDFLDYLHHVGNFEQIFTMYELLPLSTAGIIQSVCVKATFLESKYKVLFTYNAIEQAVTLSTEFFRSQGQPQAAVSILTEAATKAKGGLGSSNVITGEDIQKMISEKAHVPTETLGTNEAEKLLSLEDSLKKYIIGQESAIIAIAKAIRRTRSGLIAGTRPVGSFLFVGPTGVGKTELAKTLAKVYFGDEKFFLRLDMSEYQGNAGLAKLLGESGMPDTLFVKHLKEYPFCLFLLDEFEKASKEILNLFLQILEDGRLTTTNGEVLDLSKTIIIATSNAGTAEIQSGLANGISLEQLRGKLFEEILMHSFAPELLNRFDDIILFSPLSPQQIFDVTKLYLDGLAKQVKESKDFDFTFTPEAVQFIADQGYNPSMGARPIRRYVQDHVDNLIADTILKDNPIRGSHLHLNLDNGALAVQIL